MPQQKLTEKLVASVSVQEGRETFYDETLPGFALVVGPRSKTFVVKKWVGKQKRKITIGRLGAPREDGRCWTVQLARRKAQEILGEIAAEKIDRLGGPTLREGLELHVKRMKKQKRSERSIHSIETEVKKHLEKFLDQPLSKLTALQLDAVCSAIVESAQERKGLVNKPGVALANRLRVHASAIWNSTQKLYENLPGRNPALGVTPYEVLPKEARIDNEALPLWLASVSTLSPVRRDLQLMTLFTGLRSESIRTIRWDDIDFESCLLRVLRTKRRRPYTIPLVATHLEILRRRRVENEILFGAFGGDHGWVFPSLTRKYPQKVRFVAEPKEIRDGEKFLPGLQPLRATYNSVAMEIGIVLEDRERLMNHSGKGVNVKHYGFPQIIEHLAECQRRIEAALWQRLKG